MQCNLFLTQPIPSFVEHKGAGKNRDQGNSPLSTANAVLSFWNPNTSPAFVPWQKNDPVFTDWVNSCVGVSTGVHYFRSLSPELPCEMLYPVFLMYNQDGLLGAFGWLFQGSPAYYPYEEEELSWFKLSAAIYPVRCFFSSLQVISLPFAQRIFFEMLEIIRLHISL